MSRAGRWWRPTPRRNLRPALRSSRPRRQRYTADDLAGEYLRGYDQAQADAWEAFDGQDAFKLGYEAGRADEAAKSRQRDEQITRLARAADAAEQGDTSLLDAFLGGNSADGDGLLDVADAAGVTPTGEVDGRQLAAEVERWLRGQD